jgi:hypothetical protein
MREISTGTTTPYDIAATAAMSQGVVLALPDACVVLADASAPMDAISREVQLDLGVTDGLLVVPQPVDEVVLLSQTCDLQETTERQYHCLVAPVIAADPAFVREVSRGHRPGFAALPWLGKDRVADLARITTLERAAVAERPVIAGPHSSQEQVDFSEAVSRFLTRTALPDEIVAVLRPFVKKMKAKAGKNSDEGRCVDRLLEVRIEADPDLNDDSPALTVLMLLSEHDLPSLAPGLTPDDERVDGLIQQGLEVVCREVLAASTDVARREAWTALAELWIQPAVEATETVLRVGSVNVEVLNEEELTYGRSRRSPILDLRYLSTRAA